VSIDDEDWRASRDPTEERAAGADDARRLGGRVRAPATGNAVDAVDAVRGALEREACRQVEVRGRRAPRQP